MRNTEVLAVVKREVEAVTPSVGRVYATLLAKFDPDEVAKDLFYEHPKLGRMVRFWVVRPTTGSERRHTTGASGYSLSEQDFELTGFAGVQRDGGTEDLLEDDFDAVRDRMRKLSVLDQAAQETTVHLGILRMSGIDRVKVSEHLCHFKTLTLTVQERKRAF